MRPLLIALIALVLTACGMQFRPRVPGSDGVLPAPAEGGRFGAPEAGVRQICRTGAYPRGWIAVRYIQLRDCPRSEGEGGYNGAVIDRYEARAEGTTMVVCADQPTPRNWVSRPASGDVVCEGARVDIGEPTTKLIRRVR